MNDKTGITQHREAVKPLSSRGGTGRENVSVAAGAAPLPNAAKPALDWAKVLMRYGAIHERISTYEDDDESAALVRLCDLRDGLLAAVRSGDVPRIVAALEATNVIPGRAASDEKAGITQAERAQRTSEHPSTGMREALEAWLDFDNEPFHFSDERYSALRERALALTSAALSSTGDERREAIEEVAALAERRMERHDKKRLEAAAQDDYTQAARYHDRAAEAAEMSCLIRSLLHAAPDGGGEDSGA